MNIIFIMYSNEQGFYITLPSQSSGDVFSGNNPSEYTVRLPHWIQLKGEWEIGLHSISYTPWNIIQYLDEPISFMNGSMSGGKEGKGGKMRKHYFSVREYIADINESLKESHIGKSVVDKSNEIEFSYESNGKVTAHLDGGYTIRLRREQAIVLGFMSFEDSSETYDIESAEESGQYKANLYRETNILVYCDIVQPQIVGDRLIPLVAVVPYQTTETSEIFYAVENIHYIPVQTKNFQNIKVHLRSSTEEPIPFEHGRAAITLHLKPLNYFD